jgi:hypothetical protein
MVHVPGYFSNKNTVLVIFKANPPAFQAAPFKKGAKD